MEARIWSDLKLHPGEYFGVNEANRWMEIARQGNEYKSLIRIETVLILEKVAP